MKRKLETALLLLSLSLSLVAPITQVEATTREDLLQSLPYGGIENIPVDAEKFLSQIESQMDAYYQTYGENLYSQDSLVTNMIKDLYAQNGNSLSTGLEVSLVDYAFNYYSQLLINNAQTTEPSQTNPTPTRTINPTLIINSNSLQETLDSIYNRLLLNTINQQEEVLESGVSVTIHILEQDVLVYQDLQEQVIGVKFQSITPNLIKDIFVELDIPLEVSDDYLLNDSFNEVFQYNEGVITHISVDQEVDKFNLLVTFSADDFITFTGRNADKEIEDARINAATNEILENAAKNQHLVGRYQSVTTSSQAIEFVYNRNQFAALSEKDQHMTIVNHYMNSDNQMTDTSQEMIVSGEGIVLRYTGEGFGEEQLAMSEVDENSAKLTDQTRTLYLIYSNDQTRLYSVNFFESSNSTADNIALYVNVTEHIQVE